MQSARKVATIANGATTLATTESSYGCDLIAPCKRVEIKLV